MARAKVRGGAWTLRRSVSLPISLHPLEAVLEEPLLEMLSDQQPGVSLEGSLTSHLQARLLEVLPAPWLGELLVPALAMLPPMGSATSSQEVAKGKAKEGRAARVGSGSAKVARERARVGKAARAFLEFLAKAKEKEKEERAGACKHRSSNVGCHALTTLTIN